MNIYFSTTELNGLNFPTSQLSPSITNSVRSTSELEKINPTIANSINEEDIEISGFYKKYRSKKNFLEETKSQKKLNKIKVYFIVKSKIIKGKEVRYAVPIRSFDDLGNSLLEKSSSFLASIFYLKIDHNLNGLEYIEGKPGARPFRLDEVLDPESPLYDYQEFSLEDLILPKKYVINGGKIELAKEPELDELDEVEEKEEKREMNSLFFVPTEYEYDEVTIDNTSLTNVLNYIPDIRQKNSFNDKKEDSKFLTIFKDLNIKDNPFKLFNISNIFSLVFGNMNPSIDKNIIPVFSNLEDAQDLLITVLDEIHQPFQVRRKIEEYNTTQSSKSLSNLDDSFTFQNDYFSPESKSKLDQAQDLIMKCGIIKSSDLSNSLDPEFYHENKYQIKGPFFVEDPDPDFPNNSEEFAAKCIWRELDYWSFLDHYIPGQQEAYSWLESRHITDTDKGLLKTTQDIKIIAMGLGDFLEFWNNPATKNAEVLFIPSSNELNKKKGPLLPKKSRDKFYDYQQKFRQSKKQDTENYIYEIKFPVE